MATRPFSRFKTGIKVPRGSVLKYIPGQGYTTAPAVQKAVASAAAPAVAPFDPRKALLGEGIYQQDAANLQAGNVQAQTDRDAAVKAAQFMFNDPSNPYSTMGGIQRNNARAIAQIAANRAARGVAKSGGTTLARTDLGYDVGKNVFDATNQLNSLIGTQDRSLAETLAKNRLALGQAVTDSQGRLIDNGVGLGAGAPGAGGAAGAAAAAASPGQRGGTFDFGAGAGAFQPNANATFAKPFDYGSIKAGYFDAAGRPVASQAAAIRANDAAARFRLTGRRY